ncbi:MAG: PilN domain-containing protein [Armatimonadota bacterium]|jgi:Tfp pilus assembly protein PilN
MPSINMIAPRRAEKRRLERAMRQLVMLILAEFVFVVALCGWVFTKTLTTRANIAELNAQLQTLAPKIKTIQELDNKTAKLKPKVDLLNQAMTRTMCWYNTLDRLTQSVPASTWLTRLSSSTAAGSKDLTLNIAGMTDEQARVGETMLRLHSNPDFKSVDLHYTQKGTQGSAQVVEFEIGATLRDKQQEDAKGGTASGANQS